MVPGAALLQAAGVKMTLVPYKGGGPAMRGVIAGDVDFTVAFPSVITSQGDKVRTLVTLADKRVFKDVPTSGDLGYPDVADIATMQRVVLAPAGIPADRLAKLREAFAKMSKDKTYKTLLKKLGENDDFMNGPALREDAHEAGQGLRLAGEGAHQEVGEGLPHVAVIAQAGGVQLERHGTTKSATGISPSRRARRRPRRARSCPLRTSTTPHYLTR